jgi:hypothetical protein
VSKLVTGGRLRAPSGAPAGPAASPLATGAIAPPVPTGPGVAFAGTPLSGALGANGALEPAPDPDTLGVAGRGALTPAVGAPVAGDGVAAGSVGLVPGPGCSNGAGSLLQLQRIASASAVLATRCREALTSAVDTGCTGSA